MGNYFTLEDKGYDGYNLKGYDYGFSPGITRNLLTRLLPSTNYMSWSLAYVQHAL